MLKKAADIQIISAATAFGCNIIEEFRDAEKYKFALLYVPLFRFFSPRFLCHRDRRTRGFSLLHEGKVKEAENCMWENIHALEVQHAYPFVALSRLYRLRTRSLLKVICQTHCRRMGDEGAAQRIDATLRRMHPRYTIGPTALRVGSGCQFLSLKKVETVSFSQRRCFWISI